MDNQQQSQRQSLQIDLVLPKNFRQTKYHNIAGLFLRVSLLCLSTFYFGYSLSYLSTIKEQVLTQYFGNDVKTPIVIGMLFGCSALGAAVGALVSPAMLVFFSRRYLNNKFRNCILFINFWAFIFGGIIQYNDLTVLFVMRTLQGVCFGSFMAITPIYIKELCPKELVGSVGVLTQFYVISGQVICYALGLILNSAGVGGQAMWRVMFVVTQATIILQTIMFLINFIPQSPNSLIAKDNIQQAKRVIGLFHKSYYIQEVFREKQIEVMIEIKNNQQNDSEQKKQRQITYMGMDIQRHQNSKKKDLNTSWKAYLLGFQMPLMQQMTGINAITTQVGHLVSTFSSTAGIYTAVVIIFIQLVATSLAIPLLNYMGRRLNTLIGNFLLGIIDIVLGILFIFVDWEPATYIILVFLVLYMIVFGISLGPVVWLYVPQIISPKVVPAATSMNWLGCAVSVICLPIVANAMNGNPYPAFLFFGGWTLISFVINLIFMVQTKGLTTSQVIKKFKGQL